MEAILELKQISKRYGSHIALERVSLAVEKGSFFALIGPSGSGKTTTLRLIGGFERPDSGQIVLNGSVINELKPYVRPVSTVFQNYALFPHLTTRQNIEFGLRQRKTAKSEMSRRTGEVIDLLRLRGKEDRYGRELSGGERQRVALARSLVLQPDVLLLDEPLSALDPTLRKQVRSELKELQRRVGITFVIVTHDQEEALSVSDRLAVMKAGRIEQTGTPKDLYFHPVNRFVASFLGEVNWIGTAGVRPESLRVAREVPGPGFHFVRGVVDNSTFLGSYTYLRARLEDGKTITAEVPRDGGSFHAGESVHLWWTAADELRQIGD